MSREPFYPNQLIPLLITAVLCAVGVGFLFLEILLLSHFIIAREAIVPTLHWPDVLVGMTIYLKTSIYFAIFIGRLMHKYPGWKNRILIEVGTSLGNIGGTLFILLLWDLFREVHALMALMIVVAAFVLLRMAEEGLEHIKDERGAYKISLGGLTAWIEKILDAFNGVIAPVLDKIIPKTDVKDGATRGFFGIFMLAMVIPFILGLDDFAGYVPLFNIVNVFGFATGVFIGHMLLIIALFLSPSLTIKIVKNPVISFIGSLAFIGLALWGVFEAVKLISMGA